METFNQTSEGSVEVMRKEYLTSSSANKKPEYVKSEDKKADEKKQDMSKTVMNNWLSYAGEPCLGWESSCDSDKSLVQKYGLHVDNDDVQEIFHDAIESASENFNENHIVSQTDHDESQVDNNNYEEKDHLVDKLIKKFNQKIAKCQKRIEKANQQSKDLENQNKDLQDKYDVLKNQVNTFEEDRKGKNIEFNEQLKGHLKCVRLPMQKGVIWKKKESSNTSSVDLLVVSYDVNDLFVFDDVSIRNSQVSKMPFRKKPHDSLNVHSKNNLNNSLPRTLFRWFPKMKPLAEPVDKWIPKIVQICIWIINSGCSNHMTGNRALLTNFVEKFLGTVRFGNNDFAVIAGYGDVVIGSMTIKKVYYVEGLGHNLFSVRQFCDKGLEVAFRKSTCFVRNEDGVDLLTGDRSSNLYTIGCLTKSYREYDLAALKLVFEFCIYSRLDLVRYGISKRIAFPGYGILDLFPLWSLVSAGTDTSYLP
ncbi:hypothetical protein Tco_0360381 [Tanacetum coccineum]